MDGIKFAITHMESIFPGNWILMFKSVQQWAMIWIDSSPGSGINVYIPNLQIRNNNL